MKTSPIPSFPLPANERGALIFTRRIDAETQIRALKAVGYRETATQFGASISLSHTNGSSINLYLLADRMVHE